MRQHIALLLALVILLGAPIGCGISDKRTIPVISPSPTAQSASPEPTIEPTVAPSVEPSAEPSPSPESSPEQSVEPSPEPSDEPTIAPSAEPPDEPYTEPTAATSPEPSPTEIPETTPIAYVVYITDSGTKYHRDGCRYLSKSKRGVTLEWAQSHGYEACKVCKP
ncbi:MAG: hypothetical protein LBN02_05685 [Oscillospiraceae bacterium]|jgi:hypothetical protein|nr:hypothetical protein [Oscillospiraceae bacterium]